MSQNTENPDGAPTLKEVRLKAAEDSFRLLVESVSDYGIFMMDPEGNILSWNTGAEKLKGYRANDAIGQNFQIFYTEEAKARKHPQYELEIAVKEGRYEEEGWRVKKDGSLFWANVVITHLVDPNGETLGFGKVTRDLSERKQNEETLRKNEELARLVYEGVKDYAILTLDTEGRVQTWNEGARRIKGFEAAEIIGKHFSEFYPHDDNAIGKPAYELKEAVLTGRFEDEGWRVRKDGTRFWANVVITPMYDRNRTHVGFSKVTRDVTDRKRAEDLLRMTNESLELRISQRTEDLSRANEKLQEALRSRDEFFSIASHELRTPVTPLKLQVQMLNQHIKRGTLASISVERATKMANTIDRALDRLSRLIDNLLDVARITSGKIELHPETVRVNELISEICDQMNLSAESGAGQIIFLESSPVIGALDRIRFEQVLFNLLSNAIKFGLGKPIHVATFINDNCLTIQIKDHGVGIKSLDLSRIFERFEQVNSLSKFGSGGLGLGLFITKQIVSAQNGTISVASEENVGTTFTVVLPIGQ